ncbi:thrombospondin [Micromonospora sp. NPDC051543]|uniref:thrombospondin n=1 Tax=Micromonospora sp. NPDC051543 TaxID=3364287 RepID=UPI0037AD4663
MSRRSEQTPTRDENLDGRVDGRDTPVTETGRTDTTSGQPVVTDRDAEQTTYRSKTATDETAATTGQTGRTGEAERRAAERAAVARAATARPAETDTARTTEGEARPLAAKTGTAAVPTIERDKDLDGTTRRSERDTDLDRTTTRRPDVTDSPVDTTPARDTEPEPVTRGPKPRASLLATLGLIVSVVGALFVLSGTLAGYGIGLGAFGAVLSVLGLMATRRRHVAGKTDALFGILIGLAAVVVGVLAMTGQFVWPTTDGDWVQRLREWLDSQFVDRF